jgi:hypothetical protein
MKRLPAFHRRFDDSRLARGAREPLRRGKLTSENRKAAGELQRDSFEDGVDVLYYLVMDGHPA